MGRGGLTARGTGGSRYPRLSAYDRHCLRAETPDRPLQIGILADLDGRTLLDPSGRLRLAELRREIDARLVALPWLRRVVHHPGRLAGGPLWVDDPDFGIDRHVGEAALSPHADEAALLSLAERLIAPNLDRAHPLWRMWFLTGLADGRVGLLVVVHHALADGMTAMRLVRDLLEAPLGEAGPDPEQRRVPVLAAPWGALVGDNVRTTIGALPRLVRPSTWRAFAEILRYARRASSLSRNSERSSLNAPVGPRRRLWALRIDQRAAKRVARARGCGVNDVVLTLAAGGVRALLEARGEPVAQLRPRAGVAVALFSADRGGAAGNDIGTLHVPLPLAEADPDARLRLIAAETARAKASPMVAAEPILRAWMGRFGFVRRSMEHQRLVNLAETYLPGPPVAIDILGTRVLDLLPIAPLAGNLGLSFVALSYAGRLAITVRADADRFPDLDLLATAMEREWQALGVPAETPDGPERVPDGVPEPVTA